MYIGKLTKKYTLKENGGTVYDPIRKKFVNKTPEEINRQKVIQFLIKKLKVPADRLVVERALCSLGVEGNRKRIDIGVLDKDDNLLAVIECKDSIMYSGDDAFFQAEDYMYSLGVRFIFLADDTHIYGYYKNPMQYVLIQELLPYGQWIETCDELARKRKGGSTRYGMSTDGLLTA